METKQLPPPAIGSKRYMRIITPRIDEVNQTENKWEIAFIEIDWDVSIDEKQRQQNPRY